MKVRHVDWLLVLATLIAMVSVAASPAVGQADDAGQARDNDWKLGRTASGHPDLQGIWSNNTATPMERPKTFGEKEFLTDEELTKLKARLDEIWDSSQAGDLLSDFLIQRILEDPSFRGFDQDTGNYNAFWLKKRELDNRTSLVVDPPDGRIPAMKPEARQRLGRSFRRGSPDGPEDLTLSVRCISYGVPNILAGYNSYFQFLQTEDHVAILQELIHDVRIIPIGDKPPLSDDIQLWHGASRGRWEGDTLVVETENYSQAGSFRGASENLRVVERFTRVGRDVLEWQITFEDDSTWESPWTMMIPLGRSEDAIFEYACHEGNYGLEGILAGARAEERAAESSGL